MLHSKIYQDHFDGHYRHNSSLKYKFCPHQGTDLSAASVEDGRYLVCPKHRWMFDMEDGGKAIEADATINAVDLDGDGS